MNSSLSSRIIIVSLLLLFAISAVNAASSYSIGTVTTTSVYVSPSGNDANTGLSRSSPVQTIGAAWQIVRANPSRGWAIELMPGTYTSVPYMDFPGYVDGTYWTAAGPTRAKPIIIRGVDGPGTATIRGAQFNSAGVNYLYYANLTIIHDETDLIHFSYANHLLIDNVTFIGNPVSTHETVKVNQAQYVYIQNSDIGGAEENNIDMVAVQYGSISNNHIHNAGDWCAYIKGGSSYFTVESNHIHDCGTGGFSAGQGTGFEFMTSPWLQYETYDVKVFNNLIHDTEGAGLGVNGGYNVLLAYNTLYRVGSRSHAVEVVYGSRSCDGLTSACSTNLRAGGWGTTSTSNAADIPDQNVFIYNNIVYNPSGFRSQWQHFQFANPTPALSGSNVPSPVTMDKNLKIRGNFIWNGPSDLPIGIEDSQVCTNSNPTCNMAQLLADNSFNQVEPQLINPESDDFRPRVGGNVFSAVTYALPSFTWNLSSVPRGTLSNSVTVDYFGNQRNSSSRVVGAVIGNGVVAPPPICGGLTCTSPQLLNSTSCSCYNPAPPACTLTCTAPSLLNSTSCSCYSPPTNTTNTTTNTTNTTTTPSANLTLPVSGNYVGMLRTVRVTSESAFRNAINTASPGDVIRLAAGNYTFSSQVWIEAQGTAANPIYIVADTGRGSARISFPSSGEGFNVGGGAAYLVFEDLDVQNGNNVFHVQDGSHHITLRNMNLHDASADGDVLKINQAHNITVEGCDLARPGRRPGGVDNMWQECIDLVDSSDSKIRFNFIHDFGNIGAYVKGGSRNPIVEYNVIDNQRAGESTDPAFGVGGATDLDLLRGAQYEVFNYTFRHNLISRSTFGAVGIYDANNATIIDNVFYNNNRVLLEARAGEGPAAQSVDISIKNNKFVDASGSMPQVCMLSSHGLSGVVASDNIYWNNGAAVPTTAGCGFTPTTESGARVTNPSFAFSAPSTFAQAMALLNWSGASVTIPTNTSGNSTNTTGNSTTSCTISCTLPQLLNSTSCSCYSPPTNTTNTTTNTTNTTTNTSGSFTGTVRVYVSGESAERRNRFVSAPFSSSGALIGVNSNNEYGWMVPFADRLKLRSPGLSVQFVGSGVWSGYEDNPYSGTYPSSTAQNTSALSGTSTDDWIASKTSELTSRRFCYDVALINRGGNDGWMSPTDRKNYIKQVALLVSNGSSCNTNPLVYVLSHFPDQFGSSDEAPSYQAPARSAVSELNTQYPTRNIRFVDVYGSFYNNTPTTAFPSPTWRSGSAFNFASILLSGDSGHPARLASIYIGEVVANAVNLSQLGANSTNTTPVICGGLSCTSPQLLNTTSCSCYTPTAPSCTNTCGSGFTRGAYPGCACTCSLTCTSPQLLNSTSCSCYNPAPPACTLTCTAPSLLNSTSCSCYSPPTNTTNTTTNTTTGGNYTTAPIIPAINSTLKARLRTIYLAGQSSGNRAGVFAKVGDSITESGSYLVDIGCGGTDQFGSYSNLTSTANYFMTTSLGSAPVWCGTGNSFTRASMTAVTGWLSSYALGSTSACPAPNNTFLKCELATIKPAYAFIMYGTNDLDHYSSASDLTAFRNNLNTIVDNSIAAGTIPVLSTIPPRLDNPTAGSRVAMYNQVIVEVAAAKEIPLWNFWKTSSLSGMINQGMDGDGIHPNVYNGADGAVLTSNGLKYGYNQRNLQTLQILEKLKRIVGDNGAPDS